MCLTANYRQQLTFSWEAMETAKRGYERIKTKILDLKHTDATGKDPEKIAHYEEQFLLAINDDLNMPKALAVLWDLLKDDTLSSKERVTLAEQFDTVLGLGISEFGSETIPAEIKALAEQREKYRKEKNFSESDRIRDEIKTQGYVIDDTSDGYKLRKA